MTGGHVENAVVRGWLGLGGQTVMDRREQTAAMESRGRTVGVLLTFWVDAPARIVVQLAPARSAGAIHTEEIRAEGDRGAMVALVDIHGEHGGRLHRLDASPGPLTVSYRAELVAATGADATAPPDEFDHLVQLRPSRYCPSDHLAGWAVTEFGQLTTAGDRARAVADWIHSRIAYRPGASTVHDSAEETLLTGVGVCRDFAHLGIVVCRALGVPARFASVYAPGLQPMDFHAVFEAWHDGRWWAYDPTRMAPRPTLVRIATGRDAADTPFATVVSGLATLVEVAVTVTSEGTLPWDGHNGPVQLV